MHSVPLALTLSKYLNSAGADVGFASIVAVALLVILYFAHARETATLRDRLAEAHDRIDGLEARVSQLLQLQSLRTQRAAPAQPPAVVPAPSSVGARPMGSAVASLRRVPAGAAGAALPGAGLPPAAPPGLAGPALGSATKAVPTPLPAPVRVVAPAASSVGQDTMLVAAGGSATAAGNGAPRDPTRDPAAAPLEPATGALAATGSQTALDPAALAPTSVGAAVPGAALTAAAATGAASVQPPRVQIRTGSPSVGMPRRGTAPGSRPPQLLREPAPTGRRRGLRRLLPLLAVLAVAIVAVVVVRALTSGSPAKSKGSHTADKGLTGPFHAHDVVVAVLNGTTVSGLAKDVSDDLAAKGYRRGNVTNAAQQGQQTTLVYYIPGEKVAAEHVATALKLNPASVQLASQPVITSCSTTPTSSGSCQGDVIVSVGRDRASLASHKRST